MFCWLEEGGVLTDCSIQTQEPDETLDFDFSSAEVLNKIIMKSECLKEAFNELDMTSEVLQILMSPDNPYLRLSTFGHAGSTHVRFVHVFHRLGSRFCRSCSLCWERMQFNSEHTCFLMLFSPIFLKNLTW